MLTTCKKSDKSKAFIKELARNGGFVLKACKKVGISKQTVYNWRESDRKFAEDWDKAVSLAVEDLEKECRRRAYQGWLEPVFYQGKKVATVRRFSDTLLIFQLKALNERYRDSVKIITETEADKVIENAILTHNLPAGTIDATEQNT